MNKLRIQKIFILIILLHFFIGTILYAAQTRSILSYKKELNLTEKQEKDIKAYLFDLTTKVKNLQDKIQKYNSQLINLLNKEAEIKKVKEKIKQIFNLKADILIAQIETAYKINSVLTPKQRKKLTELRKKERNKVK